MKKTSRIFVVILTVIGFLIVGLLARIGEALASNLNIDPVEKWAWGANLGWINFDPAPDGAVVYPDHLEGYAWGENIGWIRLGTYQGGGEHTYPNDSADSYGVNRSEDGRLSGYAWSPNVGWINFNPDHGGVTIDPHSGEFVGYAWGENVGWIRLKGAGYGLVTGYRSFTIYLPIVQKQ